MLKKYLKSIHPLIYFIQNFQSPFTFTKISFVTISLIVLIISIPTFLIYSFLLKDLPQVSSLKNQPVPLTTHIKDRNGQLLYSIYENENRTLVKLNELNPLTLKAVLAIEDNNFYSHDGFSTKAILRALLANTKVYLKTCSGESCSTTPVQGGSTITQQLVKTALLTPEKSLKRKARELLLSIQTERNYSKDEILEMYLNRISFGGATYGIQEAAKTYFGIDAKDLNLAQSALLAGLPAAPSSYSPFGAHPELAKDRQLEVLRKMAELGFISWDEAKLASSQKLTFKNPQTNVQAPHFVMYVKEILSQKYGPQAVEQGGLEVITTLDLNLQQVAEKIVYEETAKVAYLKIGNGAALITNPKTGEILSMVGSRNYFDIANDGNVNVTTRPRQPGSSIKPLNYALAFQNGASPSDLIDDTYTRYQIPGQPDYIPTNYDQKYHGRVTLRTALASSYNVPAVKILDKNGLKNFIDFSHNLGITTWKDSSNYGLSLTLGGGEVTMLDLATAYGVFATNGQKVNLNPILEIKDSTGKLLEKTSPSSQSVLDPRIAFLISDILSDNFARTPTFGPRSQLNITSHQVAVKTGTTNSLRDNWTVGYTPNFLVAVWVGNNDNTPMSYVASGVTGASPIWRKITDHLLKDTPPTAFIAPIGLEKKPVCYTNSNTQIKFYDYFLPNSNPSTCITPVPLVNNPDSLSQNANSPIDKPRKRPRNNPQI